MIILADLRLLYAGSPVVAASLAAVAVVNQGQTLQGWSEVHAKIYVTTIEFNMCSTSIE